MLKLIMRWVVSALALYIVSKILPGIRLADFWSALVAVLVIGLINALIKPILFLLTLPVTILSLGLFTFVLNALMLVLASRLTPGFQIDGFGTAILGSVLFSVISTLLHGLVK